MGFLIVRREPMLRLTCRLGSAGANVCPFDQGPLGRGTRTSLGSQANPARPNSGNPENLRPASAARLRATSPVESATSARFRSACGLSVIKLQEPKRQCYA
jgi:hypothetical protein